MNRSCLPIVIALTVAATGCVSSSEAPRVSVEVRADAAMHGAPFTNDLGWEIELSEMELAARDFQFTTEGEAHVASIYDLLVPSAFAHPGHLAGGEVIGELPGAVVVDFFAEESIGEASMIAAEYDGANFVFDRSSDGFSIRMAGTATRDGTTVRWSADVLHDEARTVVGLPMDVSIAEEGEQSVAFQFVPVDPTDTETTAFDGVDFGEEAEATITADSDSGIRLVRSTQRHNFWRIR